MSLVEQAEALLKRIKGDPNAALNSFQIKAIEAIEKRDDNFLIIAPTGTGKTLVGEAGILKYGKGFYLAPLRSLMGEKYVELRKAFPKKRVVLTNKDYSIPRKVLKEADIRVLSPYKIMIYLDYLKPEDGVVVVDEIHKINKDPEMEAAVSALKTAGFRIIGLSATIHEDDIPKMSRWLNATVIKCEEERPVPLRFTEVKLQLGPGYVEVERGGGYLYPKEKFVSKTHAIVELVLRVYEKDPTGGILVWTPTRREADVIANMIANRLPTKLPEARKQVITSSEHDNYLKYTIEKGVLIHHGGLSSRNRELVEELFREKKANIVVTCYTLSHGVNFPVRYLVITTLFDHESKPLDPSTYHQIAGRAGRPGLDEFGEVITVTVGDLESYLLTKIMAEKATKVKSKIYNPWTIAKLAAQRLLFDKSIDGFMGFLKETYYAQEYGPKGLEELKKLAEDVLTLVIDAYFEVEPSGKIYPKGRKEAFAASMGLHPKEWILHEPMSLGDYEESLRRGVEAAMIATGVNDASVIDNIMDYGFLSVYLGSWKVREVAEITQTIFDAVAVYVRRLYGWKSDEFQNTKRVVEMYLYGGNPNAEYLAKVLKHDEMKRIIRNMPKLLFLENPSDNVALEYVRGAVQLIFGFKKRIYMKRVMRVVDAVLKVMFGEDVPESLFREAIKVARSEVQRSVSELGAKVIA
ncbi:MAG: hypothetical protein DRP00_02110 [Candidatus Aenigmatarchaeota archaeon]|nr:MAG: hypothetical protein DRP00_02110 [Candidatus Aenigmarchaeota archaeon]